MHLIEVTTKPFNFIVVGFSTGFMFLMESILIYWIFCPLTNVLMQAKETNNTFEKTLETSSLDILKFCSTAMSYHNKYLSIHIQSVEKITKIILDTIKELPLYNNTLTTEYCDNVCFSVQFHDIGKIYIDQAILDKPDALTPEEYDIIKDHPTKGKELFDLLPESAISEKLRNTCENVIIQHHEKLDGSGYPYGLENGEISLEGQIVAVADITDALLSWRPYKEAFDWDRTITILKSQAGIKLNSDCVNAIIKNKDKILKISSENNKNLKVLFNIQD